MTYKPILRLALLVQLILASAGLARAHVGLTDVYVKATAGPYPLLVSVHPPAITPGAAEVDIRTEDPSVTAIAASLSGQSQTLQRFSAEQIFTGSIWVGTNGAWRLTLHVTGSHGQAETTVPIPAPPSTPQAPHPFAATPILCILGLGMVACAALILLRRHALVALAGLVTLAIFFVGIAFAAARKPEANPTMQVTLLPNGKLQIQLPDPDSGLLADHNHLMHLFAVRQPQMDVLLHLHPVQTAPGRFETNLPSMAPGTFLLFADVVHQDGTPQTYVAQAGLPMQLGHPLSGDDSLGIVPGLSRAPIGAQTVQLPDGYHLTVSVAGALHPKTGQLLHVSMVDAHGNPPPDMQLYMGMSAHAAILKTDQTTFAHIHPTGTIPTAAYGPNMTGMDMSETPNNQVSFPFGFPSAGNYRLFLQMKHSGIVETGAFDLVVTP